MAVAPTALSQNVRRTIDRYRLLPDGARVVVGLSGGSDSVALAVVLVELASDGGFEVVRLAHLNHRLRASADRDEAFCRAFAGRVGLPLEVESAEVADRAVLARLSVEDAGRKIRYDFLHRVAQVCGADVIAVGHTRDDQAETFLLKLMRGAGATGLGGVYPRRGRIIRPLLDVSKADLRAYLTSRGERWVEDESNADLDNPRNRIRHRVLPELNLAYEGDTAPAIARAADLIREDGLWLDEVADERFRALAVVTPEAVAFQVVDIAAEPPPVRHRVILRAMRLLAQDRQFARAHVDAVLALLEGRARAADVPGGRWELCRGKLVLFSKRCSESK